jgi:hypothetical protein
MDLKISESYFKSKSNEIQNWKSIDISNKRFNGSFQISYKRAENQELMESIECLLMKTIH